MGPTGNKGMLGYENTGALATAQDSAAHRFLGIAITVTMTIILILSSEQKRAVEWAACGSELGACSGQSNGWQEQGRSLRHGVGVCSMRLGVGYMGGTCSLQLNATELDRARGSAIEWAA